MLAKIYVKAMSTENTRCAQILLTVSPRLCSAISEHYHRLSSSWRSGDGAPGAMVLMTVRDIDEVLADEEELPSLQNISNEQFPLFWTFATLLKVLDKSLPDPFWAFNTGCTGRTSVEVDGDRFRTHYMPRMPSSAQKRFQGGAALFGEIQTVIKGSLQALLQGKFLSQKQYLDLWNSRNTVFTLAEMETIYSCFQIYQNSLTEKREWDLNDAVQNIYQRCTISPEVCQPFILETLAIDEVQDMVCRSPVVNNES
jgi:hypothetical protein